MNAIDWQSAYCAFPHLTLHLNRTVHVTSWLSSDDNRWRDDMQDVIGGFADQAISDALLRTKTGRAVPEFSASIRSLEDLHTFRLPLSPLIPAAASPPSSVTSAPPFLQSLQQREQAISPSSSWRLNKYRVTYPYSAPIVHVALVSFHVMELVLDERDFRHTRIEFGDDPSHRDLLELGGDYSIMKDDLYHAVSGAFHLASVVRFHSDRCWFGTYRL